MLSTIFSRLRLVNPSHYYGLRLLTTASAREAGVVKRFSKEKGYGFITKKSDGTDYFVHFKSINTTGFKTLEPGQEVEFSSVQGEKGLEARDVNITNARSNTDDSSDQQTSSMPSVGFGQRRSKNRSSSLFNFGGNDSSEDGSSLFPKRTARPSTDSFFGSNSFASESSGKRETGSVKRWNTERGFGFIRRTSGGPDLFCHARSLKDGLEALEEGQTIEFRIQPTEKGEEARDVSLVQGETPAAEPAKTEMRVTGTVKRWIGEKGFGFVQRESDGTDIFVHAKSLPSGVTALEEGQKVEFDLVKGGKGDMAQNVTIAATDSST